MDRRTQAQLAKWIVALIMAALAAIFGHDKFPTDFPGGGRSAPADRTAQAPNSVRGAARAIDGDSFHLGRDEVRLKGIDAPEGRQSCERDGRPWDCGNASRDALRDIIGKDVVECEVHERDQHGRLLGTCSAAGRSLNAGMVERGMAVAYGGYRNEEAAARRARRGLWGSQFQMPRQWRDEHNRRQ